MKPGSYLAPLAVLALWQAVSAGDLIPSNLMPSPLMIIKGLRDLAVIGMPPEHLLHKHIAYSLLRVFSGFFIACVIGIPLGLLMGWSRRAREIVNPFVEILRPIPPLAWIPIAILWFGIGMRSSAFIIFLGSFFPILLNTISGVASINPILLEAARTLRADERDIFLKVLLPGSIPSICVGMRIGMGIGWMTLVAAEFTGVREGYGLGYMIMTARDIQRPDEIMAGMLVIGAIGLVINYCIRTLEAKVVRWQ
ncbi:MAG: ABC transporter permease [Desulfobacteraceae bacterium]|nr:MAG: ABC transporter permease [Desulfobacteraceae bacterium]